MKIRSILPMNHARRLIACAILVITFLFWSQNIVQVSALTSDRPSSKKASHLLPTPTGEAKEAKEERRREAVRRAQQKDREEARPLAMGQEALVEGSATTCTNGMADQYPCQNVDLLSVLPLAMIGGGDGADIWGWTDSQTGKEYALMARTNGTSFIDISDPEAPIYLGNLPSHIGASTWRDVKVYQNHAFIVADFNDDHGVQIFDLTQLRDITSPPVEFTETAHYDQIGSAHNIVINEQTGYAYAVGVIWGDQTCNGGLHMINIQNPTQPTFAGCFSDGGYTHDAQCVTYNGPDSDYQGQEICFNANQDTLTIVNVSDKSQPQMLSQTGYADAGYIHQNWLTEDHRYLLMNDEFDETENGHNTRTYIWEVSNLDEPALIGTYTGPTTAIDHNLYTHQGHAYEANYTSGLRILKLSDIANASLQEVAYFDIYPAHNKPYYKGAWSVYPYFKSKNVIVSGIEGGLFVLRPELDPDKQTPIPTPTHTPAVTMTPTPTSTATPTPTSTATPTPTATATATPTATATATPTATATAVPNSQITPTPTVTTEPDPLKIKFYLPMLAR
ncbi:MAG: choice-of-anchor B family protein [Ardenticatenaceae bacterium]